jgi:hypothetical protein
LKIQKYGHATNSELLRVSNKLDIVKKDNAADKFKTIVVCTQETGRSNRESEYLEIFFFLIKAATNSEC